MSTTVYKCFLVQPSDEAYQEIMIMEDSVDRAKCNYHAGRLKLPYYKVNSEDELHVTVDLFDATLPWPTKCDYCGYEFTDAAKHTAGAHWRWKRVDTGEIKDHQREFGPGAMWRATWYSYKDESGNVKYGHYWDNAIEPPLIVIIPGGTDWNIDSRANNCTLPLDKTHRCWVRTGEPPMVTITKGNGSQPTCAAGAGSISCGTPGVNGSFYHGMLHFGELRALPDSEL